MDKYKILKKGNVLIKNKWFRECHKLGNHPFIVISEKTKYCTVEYDYMGFNEKYDKKLEHSKEFTDSCIAIFKKHANKKAYYSISTHIIMMHDIKISKSEELATELFDYIKGYIDE